MIEAALLYAGRGYAVLPLEPHGKRPLTVKGVYDATTSAPLITRMWRRWPGANIGLAVRDDWVVIDVDVRSNGNETLKTWPVLPTTPTQITASGGMHFVLQRPAGVLRGKAGQGIDVLGSGRYIVTAPSVREGRAYQWVRRLSTTQVAPCPDWLASLIVQPHEPARLSPASPSRVDNVIDRARAYVAAIDGAVSGQNGHAQTFRVAQALVRGFALDEDTAMMLLEEYNERCSPPWSKRELRHKIKSAATRAAMPKGALLSR